MNRPTQQHQPLGTGTSIWIAGALALAGIIGSVLSSWLVIASASRLEIRLPWDGSTEAEHDLPSTALARGEWSPANKGPGPMAPSAERRSDQTDIGASSAIGGAHQTGTPEATVPGVASATTAAASTEMAAVEVSEISGIESRDSSSRTKRAPSTSMSSDNEAPDKEHGAQRTDVAPPQPCPTSFTVNFDRASEELVDARMRHQVEALARWLDAHPKATVLIEGHADAVGPEEYNLLLSYRRAKAVSAMLLKAGVRDTQVTTRAYGELMPMPGLPVGSPKNRRVTVRVAGVKTCPEL